MIIDNFGTIKPNPYRWYVPRIIAPIVDEAADFDFANWGNGRLMVLPGTVMTTEYRDLVDRATKPVRLPSLEELEAAALDKAQDGLMRAVRTGRIRHEEMRRSGSLGQWPADVAFPRGRIGRMTEYEPEQHEHQVVIDTQRVGRVTLGVCIVPGCDHQRVEIRGVGTFVPGDPIEYSSPPWWHDEEAGGMVRGDPDSALERVGTFVRYDVGMRRVVLVDPEWGEGYIAEWGVRKPGEAPAN